MRKSKAGYPEIEHRGEARSPLSFQQERVLYLNKLSADGPLWNRVSCKRLSGDLDVERMRLAVDALIARHPALRTRIDLVGGEPLQSTHAVMEGVFQHLDFSAQGEGGGERARAVLNGEYLAPFSLEGGELFRGVLVTCGRHESWLILKLHHIISDATTLHILWNDLKVLYNSLAGSVETLPEPAIDYADYARWLRQEFGEGKVGEQESYWLDQFSGQLPKLDLPADFPVPPTLTFAGALVREPLPPPLIKRLQSFSLERRVIPFSTMLTAYYLLLHHYCRQDDLVIGTVFSGRHLSPKIQLLAGFFTNTVALRARLDHARTAEELVSYVHKLVTDAHDMQDYPFERLVSKLNVEREQQRNPLFRAMFNMVTDYRESRAFQGIEREEWMEPAIAATQVDFFLDFHLKPEHPELRVEYNAELFTEATVQRMLRHYLTLLGKIMAFPACQVSELTMLDEAEEKRVLSLGESEPAPPFSRGVVELLEERAARAPEQAALLHAGAVVTCGEFNRRANRLAARLMEAGIAPGDTVAIILDRSPELVVAVFAALKAGAAYLPVDPAFPQGRVEYILQDSGAGCVMVQDTAQELREKFPSLKWIRVDDDCLCAGDGTNPGLKAAPDAPAYVIYTSGSTGKPKGVLVEHRALMNTLDFLEAKYPLNRKTILFKTNYTFDVAATELFGWLYDGGRVAVLDKGAEKDPKKLLEAIGRYGVTHVNFVPSMLDALLSSDLGERGVAAMEGLRYLFAAGEALKPELVGRFHGMIRGVRLENLYGPTEAAVYATWHSLPRGGDATRVPIGRPIANTRAYILDRKLKPVPVGVIGELCLSGAGLARGYLNHPELTGASFLPDPYREGERIYRTGDLARWRDDGLIEYLGRSDGQVKIRGFRVELGEVERRISGCRGVVEAAVKAADHLGQRRLVAYLALVKGDAAVEGVREELAAWLPGYMIPDCFVQVDRLPRLASGKVDLQGLPDPQLVVAPPPEGRAIASELEQKIIAIAEELLNTTGLGPDSNFFRLGGNSLLTLRFVAALDNELGTSLSILDFLELPTIAEIATLIESQAPALRTRDGKEAAGSRSGFDAGPYAHGSHAGEGA